MKYRPEVDGLRAVAVLPVLLFHAGFSTFSGGFVGVDVFFVISGYLITGILLEEIESGTYSLAKFYERRARRILPALFLVMLATIPFAWMWMLPGQYKDFSQSLAAVVLFASNFLFWREEGYFAAAAELKPMLHTWSLAVEEQFYLVFPLLLVWLLARGRRTALWAISGIAVISFALSEWGSRHWPSANFYLAPGRFWELMVGSLCAYAIRYRGERQNGLLAAGGVVMVLLSIGLYSNQIPFPGAYALLPVLGTALILLYAGDGTAVGKVLSSRALVGVGLVSYSAYLWHQPLFALARIRSTHEPPAAVMLMLIGASLVLAYATWRLVEQPVRRRKLALFASRPRLFAACGAGAAALVLFAAVGHLGDGLPKLRGGDTDLALLERRLQPNHGLSAKCDGFTLAPACRTSAEPEFLLWGDSFAMHLAPALVASQPDLRMQQHTRSRCNPVLGVARVGTAQPLAQARDCIQFNDSVMEWLVQTPSVKYVVLSSPMTIVDGDLLLRDGDVRSTGDNLEFLRGQIAQTAAKIRESGRKVVFVSPTPRNDRDIGLCSVKLEWFALSPDTCDMAVSTLTNRRPFELMRRIAADVPVIRLDEAICREGVCSAYFEGVALFRDDGHLTREGSALLGRQLGLAARVREWAK